MATQKRSTSTESNLTTAAKLVDEERENLINSTSPYILTRLADVAQQLREIEGRL